MHDCCVMTLPTRSSFPFRCDTVLFLHEPDSLPSSPLAFLRIHPLPDAHVLLFLSVFSLNFSRCVTYIVSLSTFFLVSKLLGLQSLKSWIKSLLQKQRRSVNGGVARSQEPNAFIYLAISRFLYRSTLYVYATRIYSVRDIAFLSPEVAPTEAV